MSHIVYIDCKEGVDDKKIAEYENKLECSFPAAYKTFLLAHNGGLPDPNAFVPVGLSDATEAVDYFLSLGGEAHEDILSVLEKDADLFEDAKIKSSEYIPIAVDTFGNYILLACGKKNAGNVYFLSNEKEDFTQDPETYKRDKFCSNCNYMYHVADDFDTWLSTFTECIDNDQFDADLADLNEDLGVDVNNLDEEGLKKIKEKALQILLGNTDKDIACYLNSDDDDDFNSDLDDEEQELEQDNEDSEEQEDDNDDEEEEVDDDEDDE
ncbi:hypothetical protein WA158_007017 [Blastocystis sp. Blastoise]